MSNQESDCNRRIVGWGIIGFMAVIGVSIALSLYLAPWRTGGLSYSFFPFHFGWVGGIFLIFIVFWIARWFFWPWRGGGRRYYSSSAPAKTWTWHQLSKRDMQRAK